jgi:autotransporter-associated beta strand protein
LSGNMGLKAADASSVAHTITLSGVLSGTGGLTKTGNGTLTLSGINTYTGNTTNNAGMLELQQPSLFTNSTVSVASGATLNLNFVGTNQVGALVLNGVSKAAGLYGNGTDPTFLTSTGKILVVPVINPNPPKMQVAVSGSTMTLAWPTNAGWILQSNSVGLASSAAWFNYPANGAVDVTTINVTMNPAKTNVFFRMLKP